MKTNNQSGFTLIEVLVSMAILSIGLLGLGSMQGFFAHGNAQAREMTRATDIAMNYIETLANIDPTTITAGPPLGQNTYNYTITDPNFPRNYNLQCQVGPQVNSTIAVTITVSWNYDGRPHSAVFPWIKAI